jgi:two-component system, response regulator PdtaR
MDESADHLVVLVVEDEFIVRYNIATCLRNAGYVVIETTTGEEAIALGISSMSIDIVFTDINLAGRANGLDVAEYFQKYRPDVLVVYTSGQLVDPRRRRPGSVFIPKPYHVDEVLSACDSLLGREPA